MASTVALYTALSGLNANARNIDLVSNNIANVNTTAFKSSRMNFATQFSRTFSIGTPPGNATGGTNPGQIGLGVLVAGTQRNFTGGTISATGDSRDLAIEGNGFFVVQRGSDTLYSRAGNFRPNALNDLVSITGDRLMGYGVDANFNLNTSVLAPVNIPLGTLTLAEATTTVRLSGNLNADGDLPTSGASIQLRGTATQGLVLIGAASPPPGPGNAIELGSRLVDIEDPALPGSGTSMFAAGQVLELRGAEKDSKTIPTRTLDITASTTLQEYMDFMTEAMGLLPAAGPNPDGAIPGVSVNAATGVVTITGNTGTVNNLEVEISDIRLLDSVGQFVRAPFVTDQSVQANGESVRTTMIAYDSLGTPVEVDLTMVIDAKTATGTTWRYYLESADDTVARALGTGTIDFDTQGQLATPTPVSVMVNRAGTGAASPLAFSLEFSGGSDNVTSLTDVTSEIAATYRDGSPIGTLVSFGVGGDGIIFGAFDNGVSRVLGQVVLAVFPNQEGLVDEGSNLFRVGPNSGSPIVAPPGSLGAGRIIGGALELSNVDISAEFITLIQSSTGYSAASRVIRTTDELMQQLLALGR